MNGTYSLTRHSFFKARSLLAVRRPSDRKRSPKSASGMKSRDGNDQIHTFVPVFTAILKKSIIPFKTN